jgi:hypothetical protein
VRWTSRSARTGSRGLQADPGLDAGA